MHECFTVSNTKWYLNSGCSKHMTRDKTIFSSFSPRKGGFDSYGDNNKGKIIVISIIGKFPNPIIWEVPLVDGLKHNLLSINQLCDKGNSVTFDSSRCRVIKSNMTKPFFTRSTTENTYTMNLNKIPSNDVCLLSSVDEYWLWHMRIAHIHTDHLKKLVFLDLVIRIPNLCF